jgi:hypothetical protein
MRHQEKIIGLPTFSQDEHHTTVQALIETHGLRLRPFTITKQPSYLALIDFYIEAGYKNFTSLSSEQQQQLCHAYMQSCSRENRDEAAIMATNDLIGELMAALLQQKINAEDFSSKLIEATINYVKPNIEACYKIAYDAYLERNEIED